MDNIKKDSRVEYRVYEYDGESFRVNTIRRSTLVLGTGQDSFRKSYHAVADG
jgi:uncharacterized protein YcfL